LVNGSDVFRVTLTRGFAVGRLELRHPVGGSVKLELASRVVGTARAGSMLKRAFAPGTNFMWSAVVDCSSSIGNRFVVLDMPDIIFTSCF